MKHLYANIYKTFILSRTYVLNFYTWFFLTACILNVHSKSFLVFFF